MLARSFTEACAHAAFARRALLKPSGTFYPKHVVAYACLASVRTTDVCGFDVRAFNAFRNNDALWSDSEHVALTEKPGDARALSASAAAGTPSHAASAAQLAWL